MYAKMVKMPFLDRFEDPLRAGTKTLTSRTRKMGNPGDTFPAFGMTFLIEIVAEWPLSKVADYWRDEGCTSRQDFIDLWSKIHYRKKFVPGQVVFVHRFRNIQDLGEKEV